jgi:CheY-like chemotaxis protein
MNIEMALSVEGCTPTSAGTVETALALLEHSSFDAAMLDVNLHGENSYPIADELAALGVPFIFSTGYGEPEGCSRFLGRPVLRKPYLQGNLITALCDLLPPKPITN